MSEPILNTLTQRLDRLERENRRLKIAGAVLLLALAAVGVMGQVLPKAVPKVVEAERFVLRDTRGRTRATLDAEGSGTLALSLYDQNGKIRASLAVEADGTPRLDLVDQNGKQRVALNVVKDASALVLADQNGKGRISLTVLPGGRPDLALSDQNGKTRLVLDVGTSGPSVVLYDENEKERAVLGHAALEATATGTVEQRPASSLVLFDRDGKVIWKVP